jgi:hypothetical protein
MGIAHHLNAATHRSAFEPPFEQFWLQIDEYAPSVEKRTAGRLGSGDLGSGDLSSDETQTGFYRPLGSTPSAALSAS